MLITRDWYLEVNGIPYATPAWECPDLSTLLDDPDVTGQDRPIPGGPSVAYRRRAADTIRTLPLDVTGLVDWDDGPIPEADQFEQLVIHMDYLKANSGFLSSAGDGTVQAIFHRGDLDPLYADVHHLGFKGTATEGKRMLRTTFDIKVMGGLFLPAGS